MSFRIGVGVKRKEPAAIPEVHDFCRDTYDITFPLFDKIDVNGPRAHPLFAFLKAQKAGWLGARSSYYLINANGSNPVRLTNDPQDDYNANWAPPSVTIGGGNWIIFTSDRLGINHYQTYIKQVLFKQAIVDLEASLLAAEPGAR